MKIQNIFNVIFLLRKYLIKLLLNSLFTKLFNFRLTYNSIFILYSIFNKKLILNL